MYSNNWHKMFSDQTGASARAILPPLLALFGSRSLLEVGCGHGHWTLAAVEAGISDYVLVDGPWNVLEDMLVDAKDFVRHNLDEPLELGRRFDMAICLEVAEHVKTESSDTVVQSLTRASDVVLFGAAIPLQGGYLHINEQWPSWWKAYFDRAGYTAFDLVRPRHWSDSALHYYYRQNAFVYVNRSNARLLEIARTEQERLYASGPILWDAVHPEKYDEMASYRAIAGKQLLKQLPRWIKDRVRQKLGR